jgi:archaeal type IV pilus assembly protein PilA
MKAIIRKDEEAVSPVIATILMVAITVVLAAVLYVMVSGLITGPGSAPKAIGVSITKSSDGSNWIMTFTSVPSGLTAGTVFLSVKSASGAGLITQVALSSVTNTTVKYQPAAGGTPTTATVVTPGDVVLVSTTWCKTGYTSQLTSGSSILYSGTFQ